MRTPWSALAGGVLLAAVGAAGLVRAAMPQSTGGGGSITADAPPIVVTGAYVRPSLPPIDTVAAYLTIRNTTDRPDVLQSVATGAGADAMIHVYHGETMVPLATGLTVPAHGTVTLAPGKAHVMIEHVYGRLKAGDRVNLDLQFRDAGPVEVVAPVLPYGTSPTSAPSATAAAPSGSPSSAGAPSASRAGR